eukprot:371214_1
MCLFSRSREWYATDMRDLWRESGVSLYWRYARTVVSEFSSASLGPGRRSGKLNQVLVLSGIALVVTVGVYGLVGVIVKIDDLGYWLAEKSSALMQALGKGLLIIAPWLMKALSIVGTLAMFLVGGGIVVHGIAPLHHAIEHFAGQQSAVAAMISVKSRRKDGSPPVRRTFSVPRLAKARVTRRISSTVRKPLLVTPLGL